MIQVDFIGRVNNYFLPKSKPLLPLFEAIINSFQSIEESPSEDGLIEICIHRDSQQKFDNSDSKEITGFTVIDNGKGFNDRHFESFQTSDSRIKESKGGKGTGRLTWLKMFSDVKIESIYNENGNYMTRVFSFLKKEDPIYNEQIFPSEEREVKTKITFSLINPEYAKKIPKDTETIAYHILEHFLIYFVSDNCPKVIISDDDKNIVLNELFEKSIKPFRTSDIFTLKNSRFNIDYFKLYFDGNTGHKLYFCAHMREVKQIDLSKCIFSLPKKQLIDDKNRKYFFVAYVTGSFLDSHVNNERIGFNIAEENDEQLKIEADEISFNSLHEKLIELIEKQLKEDLKKSEEDKIKNIEYYIEHKNPKYRQLLKHGRKHLKKIQFGLADDKLEIELHKAFANYEIELAEKGKRLLDKYSELESSPEYRKEYEEYIIEATEDGKARLSDYVIHRKRILLFLEKCLQKNEDGNYVNEDMIHKLLYPMKTTSDDNEYSNQNLWIIDERLCYHSYLASDTPLKSIKTVKSGSNKRPDILIMNSPISFDKPYAYSEDKDQIFSITIIELKKPERNDYSDTDNPFAQIDGYIELFLDGKAESKDRRKIRLVNKPRFYCYIIASLTEKMKRNCRQAKLNPTPDEWGYFGYNPHFNAYYEFIDYEKLLADAKKRNKVLFDKLNLPI